MVLRVKMANGQSVKADQSKNALSFAGFTRVFMKQTGITKVPNAMKPIVRTVQANPIYGKRLWKTIG